MLQNCAKSCIRYAALAGHRCVARALGTRLRMLLIQCPMRSGSSLLSHLLNGHHEFCGLGEANQSYTAGAGVADLYAVTALKLRQPRISGRYIVDKIVHNRYLDAASYARMNAWSIFLLRDPRDCVESIVERIFHGDQHGAIQYFEARLAGLGELAAAGCPERQVWLTYEQLQHQTMMVQTLLSQVLEVAGLTCDEYKPHRFTGQWGHGDGGERIAAGRILRDRPKHGVELMPGIADRAQTAYAQCVEVLMASCQGLPRTTECGHPVQAEVTSGS